MSEHTPGPWVIDSENVDLFTQNQSRMWINATGMHIGYVDGPRTSERIANARLIAAAPEMYEALEMFLAYNDQGGPISFNTDAMWAKARSVLAKIEGGGE